MKIAIISNYSPFVCRTIDELSETLRDQLTERGHQVNLVRVPFRFDPASKIVDHILASRLISLRNAELAIALEFPSYFIPHPNKVVWVLHQFRQAYDLWNTPFQSIPSTPEGKNIRQVIMKADTSCLAQARKIFVSSSATSTRLRTFNGLESELLIAPLRPASGFHHSEYGDYVVYLDTESGSQSLWSILEALKSTRFPVRLVAIVDLTSPADLERKDRFIRDTGLQSRVQFLHQPLSEQDRADLLAGALACACTLGNEDWDYRTVLEAYCSRKAIIACTDGGAVPMLVKDGENGRFVGTVPEAIGQTFDLLYQQRDLAKRMGEAGYELIKKLGIDWGTTVNRLTQ